jgi:pimeloyl-ACP methyl ester carboxylesterase
MPAAGGAIPDAELVVIEGAAHLPALERPGETAKLVRRFLGIYAAPRAELQDLRSP